jgi:hypothetical protein
MNNEKQTYIHLHLLNDEQNNMTEIINNAIYS